MPLCGNCSVLDIGTTVMWNNPSLHFQMLVMHRPNINVSNLLLSKMNKAWVSQDPLGGGPRSWGTADLFRTGDYLICHAGGWASQRKGQLTQRSAHWSVLPHLIKCQRVQAGWSGGEREGRWVGSVKRSQSQPQCCVASLGAPGKLCLLQATRGTLQCVEQNSGVTGMTFGQGHAASSMQTRR